MASTDSLVPDMQAKNTRGFGILNLTIHNETLLMKNLHKFLNRLIPWINLIWNNYYRAGKIPSKNKIGSFWWKDIPRTLNTFRGFSKVTMQDGHIVRPWYDEWNNTTLFSKYLELFSYAINKNITVMQAREIVQHQDMFYLPMSAHAFNQLQLLSVAIQAQPLFGGHDIWRINGTLPNILSQNAYKYGEAPTPTPHTSDIYLVVEFKMPSKAEGVLLITPTQSF